jgi:hypothetical protein
MAAGQLSHISLISELRADAAQISARLPALNVFKNSVKRKTLSMSSEEDNNRSRGDRCLPI